MATAGKAALRKRLLSARRAVADDVRAAEACALQKHLGELTIGGATVCAYVPVGDEPGSVAMLDGLLRRGLRVLLPVARTSGPAAGADVPLPLMWGEYRPGGLVTGRLGLLEPAQPWLPAAALAEAALVVVPALAVDRRGVRLGRGAGFYDRSLVLRGPNVALIAVVRDAELVDTLPSEPHDVPMTHALTPGRGVVAFTAE
ncbi:MAG: 5-formyltetrahydrofolate cyclo-ligase [Mycobacterium sp.]